MKHIFTISYSYVVEHFIKRFVQLRYALLKSPLYTFNSNQSQAILKNKKTLTSWLTNNYLLIIRNEENFAEKRTLSFNYAKLIVLCISSLIILFTVSFYLVTGALATWLDPREKEADANRKIIILSARVDSLSAEVNRKDNFIMSLKTIITGTTGTESLSAKKVISTKTLSAKDNTSAQLDTENKNSNNY